MLTNKYDADKSFLFFLLKILPKKKNQKFQFSSNVLDCNCWLDPPKKTNPLYPWFFYLIIYNLPIFNRCVCESVVVYKTNIWTYMLRWTKYIPPADFLVDTAVYSQIIGISARIYSDDIPYHRPSFCKHLIFEENYGFFLILKPSFHMK